MRTRALFGLLGVPALVGLLWAVAYAGDKETADFFFKKAEKSYRAKAYEEAAGYYRRALEEYQPHPQAAYGLGQAMEKLGRSKEALDAYLTCETQIKSIAKPTRTVARLAVKVKKAIAKLGKGFKQLEVLDKRFVKDCLSFARKHVKNAPGWAKRAYQSALVVDPVNKTARDALEKMGLVSVPSAECGGYEPIIGSDSLSDWDPGVSKKLGWSCRGGVIRSDPPEQKGYINFKMIRLEGAYSYRGTFRMIQKKTENMTHGFYFGSKGSKSRWGLFMTWTDDLVLVRFTEEGHLNETGKLITGFNRKKWHDLQIDVTPGEFTAFVDGKKALSFKGEPADAFDGALGVFTQGSIVEIKDLGLKR